MSIYVSSLFAVHLHSSSNEPHHFHSIEGSDDEEVERSQPCDGDVNQADENERYWGTARGSLPIYLTLPRQDPEQLTKQEKEFPQTHQTSSSVTGEENH